MFPFWSVALLARRVRWCQWWRDAGSPGGKIYYAEYYRLPAVAPFYFLPGILAGAAIDIPAGCRVVSLNGCCWRRRYFCGLGLAVLAVMAQRQSNRSFKSLLSRGRLLWLTPLISAIGVVAWWC